jgi:glucose/arabinose dehydrogenase
VIVDKGRIYFSTGYAVVPTNLDRKSVPATQNPNSSLGKIFEIGPGTDRPRQPALGFRNVQGLAVLRQDLPATEQGPEGGDELNLIKEGKNYGWPYVTYGTNYSAYDYAPETAAKRLRVRRARLCLRSVRFPLSVARCRG